MYTVPAFVLFAQTSPLGVTVQFNCYTGLKTSTFKWNQLCGEAKHVKAKPLAAYLYHPRPPAKSWPPSLHALHLPLLSKGEKGPLILEPLCSVDSLTDSLGPVLH